MSAADRPAAASAASNRLQPLLGLAGGVLGLVSVALAAPAIPEALRTGALSDPSSAGLAAALMLAALAAVSVQVWRAAADPDA